jgi:hypothetical protein
MGIMDDSDLLSWPHAKHRPITRWLDSQHQPSQFRQRQTFLRKSTEVDVPLTKGTGSLDR